jgi:hypothetical protein
MPTDSEREMMRKRRERERLRRVSGAGKRVSKKPIKGPEFEINMTAVIAVCSVAAAVVLVFVLSYFIFRNNSQIVYLNDVQIGIVRLNRREPFTAEYFSDLAVAKLAEERGTRILTDDMVTLVRARTGRDDLVMPDFIISELRRNIDYKLETAAIYVNGQRRAVVINEREAEAVLRRIKERYFQEDLNIIEDETEFVEYVDIRIIASNADDTGVLNGEQAYITLNQEVPHRWSYTVRPGDMAEVIASRNGMRLEDLAAENPSRDLHWIHPGDVLNMVTSRPMLSVITYELRSYMEVIPKPVEYVIIPGQPASFRRVREQGSDGEQRVTAYIVRINGFEQEERDVLDVEVIVAARREIVEIGQ